MDWGAIVGRNVRRLRLARELTLDELAEAAGVAVRGLGALERGQANPSLAALGRVAAGLGVPLSELVEEPTDGEAVPEDGPRASSS